MAVAEIPLTQGLVAIVDEAEVDAVLSAGPWHAVRDKGTWYARRSNHRWYGQPTAMHSVLTGWPLVDHVNGNGLDNRRSNLRPATVQQNNRNAARPSHNTSGFKGVSLYRRTGRWRASITVDGQAMHLGYFDAADEAARAYDAAALHHFGEFARPNFPARTA